MTKQEVVSAAKAEVIALAQRIVDDCWPDKERKPPVSFAVLTTPEHLKLKDEYKDEHRLASTDLATERPFHAALALAAFTIGYYGGRKGWQEELRYRDHQTAGDIYNKLGKLMQTLGSMATTIREGLHQYFLSEDGERIELWERPAHRGEGDDDEVSELFKW